MANPLNTYSGMPQMNVAFSNWTLKISFDVVTQTIVDGFPVDTTVNYVVDGVWQPLSPEEIQLKPDGQRSWEWIDFHIRGKGVILKTNDLIVREGIRYKVMSVKDYRLNNYTEYHLIKDYEGA